MEKLGAILLIVLAGCSRAPDPAHELERGVAYLQEDKPAKAAAHFERALAAAPPTPQALNYLAVCQLKTGHAEAAVTNLLAALRLNDSYAMAHYNLGLACLETGRPSDAVTHLRQAARAPATPADTSYYLGLAYVQAGAWPQAADTLTAQLKTQPPTPELLNLLGIVHVRQRDYREAEPCFRQSIERDPKFAAAYLNLATLEQQHLARPKDAMLHYQKYLDLAPKSERRNLIQHRIRDIAQKLETQPKPAATTTTVAALPPKPAPPDPPKPLPPSPARDKELGGSGVPAATGPTLLTSPPPPPAPVPTAKTRPPLSTQPLRAGNRARANAHFTKAVQAHQATNLTAAIAGYASAIAADPAYAAAYYNLAIASRASGQPDKALDNYELALRANSDYTDARFNYAILLAEQGYTDDAIAQYRKLLQTNPGDAAAHLSLASLYARHRATVTEARRHYEAYLRLAPNSPLARDIRRWLDANR